MGRFTLQKASYLVLINTCLPTSYLVGNHRYNVCYYLYTMTLLQVEQSKVLIKEGGVQLLLTIVDTPGFGDAVDNSNW